VCAYLNSDQVLEQPALRPRALNNAERKVRAWNYTVSNCLYWIANIFFKDQISYLKQRLEGVLQTNHDCLHQTIPDHLIKLLITAEDRRFWGHGGVDVSSVGRAIYRIIVFRQMQGASTIEQQLVRTIIGDRRLSIQRKLHEVMLACVIGSFINKRELAILYLCCAYYGWKMNSLAQACHRLGFTLERLTCLDSAELVARLKYPEPQHPSFSRSALIANRVKYILQQERHCNRSERI
jgi:penicillin-binding protein 1A